MYSPTPQQTACYDFARDPRAGSLAIDAKAGSGKTSTLRDLARQLPGSGLATSFSKSTVRDLSSAMPSNWDAIGMHALGFRGIKRQIPDAKVDSRGNILYDFIKTALEEEDNGWKLISEVRSLAEMAALSGIIPNHDRYVLEDTPENWEAVADLYDLTFSQIIYETARQALIHSNTEALKGNITFTHMLTLPLFFAFPLPQYPKIIIDEAQDLNVLQHMICERVLRSGGRAFLAGDPSQAIYAFSGAMSDSFTRLSRRFEVTTLPLTVSWRCGKEIIREAQKYVPSIEYAPTAINGSVLEHSHIHLDELPRTILCRNNAPLMKLALRLFIHGHTCELAGRDVGAGLKSTINRLASGKKSNSMRSEEFLTRLYRWAERETTRRPSRKPNIDDKVAALSALAEHHSTVGGMRSHIAKLYVDPDSKERRPAEFHLSTIHKAKGREWDKIAFLDPHLLPAKWAKEDWEVQQEHNLSYVAITRAKQELHYISTDAIV